MKLLLISNSTNAGETYLQHCIEMLHSFLTPVRKNILFIPYAAVSFSYDLYIEKVRDAFSGRDIEISSIHQTDDPVAAVENAEAIMVGGGNTFHLLRLLQEKKLIEPIRRKVFSGMPYTGWSAGANLACPTIKTTNDMPIVEPISFHALYLIPFQINPHYTDAMPEKHGGETREMRIAEFLTINTKQYVIGLREGSMLYVDNRTLKLLGNKTAKLFHRRQVTVEITPNDNIDYLLNEV